MVKTKADDEFLTDLLGEVDSNIPAPAERQPKIERSGDRRKSRALSPIPGPVHKRQKRIDIRPPSPPAPDMDVDDGFVPPLDEEPMTTGEFPMSDPAPSSPAAKVAERKAQAQLKQEPKDDDDEDVMEVAHAGAVKTTSVNITGARPQKKLLKPDPYPSPASSSPPKAVADKTVDSSSWNNLTERLNVVSSPSAETRGIGKIDHRDAIEADGSLNFFWTDYTEVNGSLCLFGKVLNKKTKSYVSCFVKVDNILRKLYFLPRQRRVRGGEETGDDVEMMDVYTEVDELMTKMKVGMYKIKASTRKYAFELPDVPKEAQYMKLLYPYTSQCKPVLFASGSYLMMLTNVQTLRLIQTRLGRPSPAFSAPTLRSLSSLSCGRTSWAPAGSKSRMLISAPSRMLRTASSRFWLSILTWSRPRPSPTTSMRPL